jgi:hypothetical protein
MTRVMLVLLLLVSLLLSQRAGPIHSKKSIKREAYRVRRVRLLVATKSLPLQESYKLPAKATVPG